MTHNDSLSAEIQTLLPMVETLLNTYAATQADNASLRAEIAHMKLAYNELTEKTAQAKTRVDDIIHRLKILEQ